MGVPEFSSSLTDFNQAQLDAIETATAAVLAAVQAIKNTDIAALNTKVGTNADASGTATLFARLGLVAGYVDSLESSVGWVNDAPSAAGSIFARLALLAARDKTLQMTELVQTVGASTWLTVVNVAGAGVLYGVGVQNNASMVANTQQIRITVDGVVSTIVGSQGRQWYSEAINGFMSKGINLHFSSSLKVEISHTHTGSLGLTGVAQYGLV